MTRVTLVHLGRAQALGGARRLAAWEETFAAAGIATERLALLPLRRHLTSGLRPGQWGAVIQGRAVPETLAWPAAAAAARLRGMNVDAAVCITSRAYHPLLARTLPTILDYVDVLSASYRDRARIVSDVPRRLLFGALAMTAQRFESRPTEARVAVSAGWAEARTMDATWIPITVRIDPSATTVPPDVDVIFFGNLAYPPNLAAVRRLAEVWPLVASRRPGTTLALAGATPLAEVREVAARHGWTLWADFDAAADVVRRARVAVAPLAHTSGIQIKVLEAAALGVAQVVSPAALRGMAPGFPVTVAADDRALVDEMIALLDDPGRRQREAAAARQHVAEHYSAQRWAGAAAEVVARALA